MFNTLLENQHEKDLQLAKLCPAPKSGAILALTVSAFQACSPLSPPSSPVLLLLVTVSMFQCTEFLVLVSLGLFGFGIWRARENWRRNVEHIGGLRLRAEDEE